MKSSIRLSRWGNSLGLRLPKAITAEAGIREGDTVDLSVQKGVIEVRPARRSYSLNELVSKITPRNRHGESGWGTSKGREQW